MYFHNTQSLQESVLFTVKNVLDWLFLPSSKAMHTKRKVEEAEREFYKYYQINFDGERMLRFAINQIDEYDILDIFEIRKFLKDDILYKNLLPESQRGISQQQAYAMLFYMRGVNSLPDVNTSYIFPYVLEHRNIIYFVYDENQIKAIYILGSKNIHDFTQPITFIRLDQRNIIDKSVFDK